MATLTKLKVGGIRSFGADDDDYQFIYFEQPFNLILGRNGCGKTTIIESLKYACTGTLPSGQGVNFVRDPKLDRKVETRGQVKLNYMSCHGKESTITRNVSTTQQFKALKFKTLETIAEVIENGKPKHLSGRCADMDELVSLSLGVSKPILNHVIFCHQEDSHWPLDESRKVKEKFDEIFDSTKYNKCMTVVRNLRNETLAEIRVHKANIQFLESNVGLLKQKRGELELLTNSFDGNKEKIKEYEKTIAEYEEEYNIWYKKYQEYEKLKSGRDTAKNDLSKLEHEAETQRKYISVEFTGTEDELQSAIKDFDGQLQAKEKAVRSIQSSIKELENSESRIQQKILEVQKIIGKLESDKVLEQRTKEDRDNKISNLAKGFGLPALVDNATEVDASDLYCKVKKEYKTLASSICTLKLNQEKEQSDLQEDINKCLEAKTKLESELRMKEDSIHTHKNDKRILEDKLNDVTVHRERKQQIDRELEKCREDHDKARKAEDPQALANIIEDHRQLCARLEERQKELSAEVVQLFKYQETQKDLKKSEDKYKEVQSTIRRLRAKNFDFFSEYLKDSSDSSIKYDLEMLVHKLKREIDQLKSQLVEKNQEVTCLDQERKHKKVLVEKKQSELSEKKEAIFKLCGKRKLSEILDGVQAEIDGIQADRAMYTSTKVVIRNFLKQLEREPCCPLCRRNFDHEYEVAETKEDLNKRIRLVPNQLEEESEKLSKLQEKQRQLLKLEPIEKDIKYLEESEIHNLQNDLGGLELVLDTTREEITCLETRLRGPEGNLKLAESIQSDVFDIDRCEKESKQLARQIELLKRDIPLGSTSRTSEQAVAEQQFVQDELSAKRREKDEAEERQHVYTKQINNLEQKINTLVAQQLKITELVQQEESMKQRLVELSTVINKLEVEVKELNQKMKPTIDRKMEAEEALDTVREKHKREIQKLEKEKSEREMAMNGISLLDKSLTELRAQNIAQTLNEKKQTHEQFVSKNQDLKERRDKLTNDSIEMCDALKEHTQRKKELEGNLILMKVAKQIEKQKKTLACAEQTLGNTDSRGIVNKINEIDEKKSSVKSKIIGLKGKQDGLQENIASRKKELDEGHLKNAEKKFKEKLIQLTVRCHAEKDLQKYYNALDYAMQTFHKERMASVNKIIRELWRLIYKGNDIDHIEIKTDEAAMAAATQATDKKRAYNYRVVQLKNGSEIEMRGRCSAGQKVLASLIIRMALAETFSANCGILTLDEPTTNLDRQNILSLCRAITEIVHERLDNRNFQLLVITHDRDFLQMMSDMDFFSHYWEVSRDHQSKSRIKKKSVDKA